MQLCTTADTVIRKAPGENTPTVAVVVGGEENGPDVGLVRVSVPVGCGMPAHAHGGSDVILTPVAGQVTISDDNSSIVVDVGASALVRKHEKVALTNSSDEPAEVIVAAGPANFVAGIRQWPEPASEPA